MGPSAAIIINNTDAIVTIKMRIHTAITDFFAIMLQLVSLIKPDNSLLNTRLSKEDLKLMVTEAVYSFLRPGDNRMHRAEQIYKQITRTYRGQELFVQGVRIRRLAALSHGEPCDLQKQLLVDNIPDADHLLPDVNLQMQISSIISWQRAILESDELICDFRQNLECKSISATCQCKQGETMPTSKGKQCVLTVGQNCGADYQDGTIYYDPFENLTSFTVQKSPPCTVNSSCTRKQFFYRSKCWCDQGKTCGRNALGLDEIRLEMNLERNAVIAANLEMLKIGHTCSPEAQRELLNPSLTEQRSTADRQAVLRTLSDEDIYFCSPRAHLNCTESTRRCACWRFMTSENRQCRIQNLLPCQKDLLKLPVYSSGPTVGQTMEMLQVEPRKWLCIGAATCRRSNSGIFRCECRDQTQAGAHCNETRAALSKLLDSIWSFPNDDHHLNVFHEFNRLFLVVEMRMVLRFENDCYAKNHQYFAGLLKFIFKIFEWPQPEILFAEYERALGWAKEVVTSNIQLCDGFQGLVCVPVEHRCRCLEGSHWNAQKNRCELDSGEKCEFHPVTKPFWNRQCPSKSSCSGDGRPKVCKCDRGLDGYRCHQLAYSWPTKRTSAVPVRTTKFAFSMFKTLEEQGIKNSAGRVATSNQQQQRTRKNTGGYKFDGDDVILDFPIQVQTGNEKFLDFPPEPSVPGLNNSLVLLRKYPSLPFDNASDTVLKSMVLPLNASCDPSYDNANYQRAIFEPEFFQSDISGKLSSFLRSQLFQQTIDMPRCNGFLYLECDNKTLTCQCNVTFDLEAGNGGRCYIKTNDLCVREGSGNEGNGVLIGKKRQPPPCNKDHVCDRIRFNLFKCRPYLRDERLEVVSSKGLCSCCSLYVFQSFLLCLLLYF